MPRRAKSHMIEEAVPAATSVQEMQRRLEQKRQDGRRIKVEAKQLEDAIAEALRGQQAKRAAILGAMLLEDRSDAGCAFRADYLERIEHRQHRELFGLAPRPHGMLGAAIPADPNPGLSPGASEQSEQTIDGPMTAETEVLSLTPVNEGVGGNASLRAASDVAIVPGEPAHRSGGDGDPDRDLATAETDGSSAVFGGDGDLPDREEPVDDAVASVPFVPSHEAVEPEPAATIEGATGTDERNGAAPVPDRDDTPESEAVASRVGADRAQDAAPTSFAPRTFLSTFEARDDIKALGLKKNKRDDGLWTVTGVTVEQVDALAALKLKPYEPVKP